MTPLGVEEPVTGAPYVLQPSTLNSYGTEYSSTLNPRPFDPKSSLGLSVKTLCSSEIGMGNRTSLEMPRQPGGFRCSKPLGSLSCDGAAHNCRHLMSEVRGGEDPEGRKP